MSFHEKGFWMVKGSGHLDAESLFNNSPTTESKRPHQWFADPAEQELFPNKKQAVETPDMNLTSENQTGSLPWDSASNFQSVPNQFIDRLFGPETTRTVGFNESIVSHVGPESPNMRKNAFEEQFGNPSSIGLSMSYGIEDTNTCLSYGGIRKVKVNQVKESDNGVNETSFISIGQAFGTENEEEAGIGSTGSGFGKGNDNTISFEGFNDEADIDTLARPMNNYNLLYNQSLGQTLESPGEKELVVGAPQAAKPRAHAVVKNKSESKQAKKEAPNSFPSNVRTLIATGMLDGVPVKYVALSREELRGVIKGSGYLCGCQTCNYSKALNAYEFERHAGCKTKHPNNHIYFENGKTIYQIVQELRSTPTSLLFDAIQTVAGSPINQKAFRTWKESFQAATRELQRIYGKEELNL